MLVDCLKANYIELVFSVLFFILRKPKLANVFSYRQFINN